MPIPGNGYGILPTCLVSLSVPEVEVQADPIPCNARASQRTGNDSPKANTSVDRNIMQKPPNMGIVYPILQLISVSKDPN